MKVAFVIYRRWGYDIFKNIYQYQKMRGDFSIETLIYPPEYEFVIDPDIKSTLHTTEINPKDTAELHKILKKKEIDIVCLFSWSWIVRKPLLDDFICLCLHPSPLPKYRGGTPIQNQIINGETDSAVTLFRMNEGIDAGDIYQQTAISLLGDVNDIFNRMIDVGTIMTKSLISDAINNDLQFKPQKNLDKHPPLNRRKPEQSEIDLNKVNTMTFQELNNIVRGLLDPYPNAFIKLKDQIVKLHALTKYKVLPEDVIVLSNSSKNVRNKNKLFLKVKDGYAKIYRYKIV
jgi:methionyl-tRNA formyltransferase